MRAEERLIDAMNGIGDDLVRDAEDRIPVTPVVRKNKWVGWVALAASLFLIAAAVPVSILHFGLSRNASREMLTKNLIDEYKQLEENNANKAGGTGKSNGNIPVNPGTDKFQEADSDSLPEVGEDGREEEPREMDSEGREEESELKESSSETEEESTETGESETTEE